MGPPVRRRRASISSRLRLTPESYREQKAEVRGQKPAIGELSHLTSDLCSLSPVLCLLTSVNCRPMPLSSQRAGRLVFEWLLPVIVALITFLIYLNGAFFSPYSAL